jgi:chromatin segregation and condensation protein Rec8/ScpA/Scc1 (kleisin family)
MALRSDVTVLARKTPTRKPQKADDVVTALGVVAPSPIYVESPKFTGSLATLFACVRDRKVDILDVPLLPICEAYFTYLLQASLKDLDQAAAALAALAYMLERKAWALLPVAAPEPESEEAFELIAPTAHEYEQAIFALRIWEEDRERMFFRPPGAGDASYEIPFEIGNVTILDLARAFEKLLTKAEPAAITPLSKPKKSLAEHMKVVLKALTKDWATLDDLVQAPFTKEEAVYWFLSLLELIRLGQARVKIVGEDVGFARVA